MKVKSECSVIRFTNFVSWKNTKLWVGFVIDIFDSENLGNETLIDDSNLLSSSQGGPQMLW